MNVVYQDKHRHSKTDADEDRCNECSELAV